MARVRERVQVMDVEEEAGASHERPSFRALSATTITRKKFGGHGERLCQTHRCVSSNALAARVDLD